MVVVVGVIEVMRNFIKSAPLMTVVVVVDCSGYCGGRSRCSSFGDDDGGGGVPL